MCNTNDVFNFIKDLSSKTKKTINLSIVGGEPTLHPHLISFCNDIIRKISSVHVEVLTNLSNEIELYFQLLKLGVKLSASWHGTADKTNIGFAKKLHSIPKKYIENGQIEIRIMLEHDNWNNSIRMLKMLMNKFKQHIEISLLLDKNGKLLPYSDSQISQYYQYVKQLPYTNNELIARYNDGTELAIQYNGIFLRTDITFKGWCCNAGIDNLYIHVDGNVYNCERFYEQQHHPICNLASTNGVYVKEMFQKCICTSDYCTCDLTARKELICNEK